VCKRCGQSPCVCEKQPPVPCAVCNQRPCICEKEPPEPCPDCHVHPCVCEKLVIKLADGKTRKIQHMAVTSFWSPDGKPISASQFIERMYGDLPALFKDEDELRILWSKPNTRKALLEALEGKGYGQEQLVEISRLIDAEQSDIFDVLAYIAFALPTLTRAERVDLHRGQLFTGYDYKQQEFLRFVLDNYIKQGVSELAQEKLPKLIEINYHSISEAAVELGSVSKIRDVFTGFQERLYLPVQ
jgi:type I restriction enzyme, R subunit